MSTDPVAPPFRETVRTMLRDRLLEVVPDADGCTVSMAEDAVRGPGTLVPQALRQLLLIPRNRETLDGRLADFKHPKRFVVVDGIPRTSTGKPLRRALAASLEQQGAAS